MKAVIKIATYALALLCLLMVVGYMMPDRPGDKFDRAAEACWKDYERKSLTPNEKIGIAKFCEGLEARAKNP